ncbi:MAG: hypothetical protein CO093_04450 [Alphaproteobacteria bacterium CG_4_9_14_3_um_filter_47_13]|nr:MAG: hypothetical protein CO093_04450 [Alphaproteobacteria bacterium CG_4_9_14_3_um_filter_47_13]
MDVTMVQKLAFASAHFQLHDGSCILDIGCARGKGSYHIAALNPRLQVTGMDYDPLYIEEARKTYKLPNLSYVQGDARKLSLGDMKYDAIFNSSVMHEIYSFSNYNPQAAVDALQAQLEYLKLGGIILFRDFMRAAEPDVMVYMDLPPQSGKGHDLPDLSYVDLLKFYAQIADSMKPEELQGFFLEDLGAQPDGWQRFYLSKDRAYEFIWRKEYQDRFRPEAKEKYGVWTAQQYRDIPESLGARVVYTAPYRNPWIARHWHENKFRLYDETMNRLMSPPSNYIAVVQKTEPDQTLRVREHRGVSRAPYYLQMAHFKNRITGDSYDMVSRPGKVYDVIPYGWNDRGHPVIYAKSGYPRPLVNCHPRQMTANLDGRTWSGHMVEPLAVANIKEQGCEDVSLVVKRLLKERAGFEEGQIDKITPGLSYFTAPADINEKVSSVFIKVSSGDYERDLKGRFSGFSADGSVRAYDIQDLLRGVQVGMLAEARLEMNIYALMRTLGIRPDQSIGDCYDIAEGDMRDITAFDDLSISQDKVFVRTDKDAGNLKVLRSLFIDEAKNKVLTTGELEFCVPAYQSDGEDVSANSVIVVPVVKDRKSSAVLMGVERREFPSVQEQDGQSGLVTVPGYRLSSAIRNLDQLKAFLDKKFTGAEVRPLGESYFPSMGVMPDRVFPHIVTGRDMSEFSGCSFIPLQDLFVNLEKLHDAHLILVVCWTVHALDLWEEYSPSLSHDRLPACKN